MGYQYPSIIHVYINSYLISVRVTGKFPANHGADCRRLRRDVTEMMGIVFSNKYPKMAELSRLVNYGNLSRYVCISIYIYTHYIIYRIISYIELYHISYIIYHMYIYIHNILLTYTAGIIRYIHANFVAIVLSRTHGYRPGRGWCCGLGWKAGGWHLELNEWINWISCLTVVWNYIYIYIYIHM